MQLRHVALFSAVLCACEGGGGLRFETPAAPDAAAPATTGAEDPSTPADGAGLETGSGSESGDADRGGAGGSVLVGVGASWQVATSAPQGWMEVDFDDSAWERVKAPMGRGYPDVSPVPDGGSLFARFTFEASFDGGEPLELRLQRDDAARAYLDGVRIGAWNLAGDAADGEVTASEGYAFFVAMADAPRGDGPHTLAIELVQGSDPDLLFSARLRTLGAADAARAETLLTVRTRSRDGRYAPDNAGAAWIETQGGAFVQTLGVWAGTRREHLLAWNAGAAGSDVDAVTSATAGAHHARIFSWDHTDESGAALAPGAFVFRAEFTEDNSNEGAPAGPTLALAFDTREACDVVSASETHFADVAIATPCP